MNVKQLKEVAEQENVDLGDAKKKADIQEKLIQGLGLSSENTNTNNMNGECTNMEELRTKALELGLEVAEDATEEEIQAMIAAKEMETNEGGEANTEIPAEAKKDVFHLNNGEECSKSAFIREKFTVDNMSRKAIADKYDIPYRTVYGATVNMENEAEPTGRGRSASNPEIFVSADGDVLTYEEVKGEAAEGEETPVLVKIMINEEEVAAEIVSQEVEGTMQVQFASEVEGEEGIVVDFTRVKRNDWIVEQVGAGVKRADVAKKLGLSYGVVYGATKELEGTKQVHEIEYNGEKMSRSEYIRKRYAEGIKKADIAKELGVEYSVVWSATKVVKTDQEKYEEALEKLAKFAEKMDEATAASFNAAVESMKAVKLKVEEDKSEETEEVEAAEPQTEATDAE